MAATTEPRLPLSRERILAAAVDVADENGIESLTMRRLGNTLGFEAMSLYNHVANKDDLLDGMIDRVLAETEAPSPSEEWDAAIRASALSVHHALRRHPWACSLLMSAGRGKPGSPPTRPTTPTTSSTHTSSASRCGRRATPTTRRRSRTWWRRSSG